MPQHSTSPARRPAASTAGFTEFYLAAIPLLDVILDQVGNVADVRLLGLSVFQVVRGPLLLLSLALLVPALSRASRSACLAVAAVFVFPCVLVCSGVLEAANRSALQPETLIAVLQSFYWVAVLALVLLRAERAETSHVIDNGLMAGGVLAAICVIVVLYIGGGTRNIYQDSGVNASWGWFFTTKGLSGQLLVCSVVALVAGTERKARWPYAVAACSGAAAFLTYQRTGLVALVFAAAWMFISRWRRGVFILVRDLAVIGAAAYLVLSVPRVQTALVDNLSVRWHDVLDETMRARGRSGSGRASLLPDAWAAFVSGDAVDVSFGRGFAGMLDTVEKAGYIRIHTHNDALDVLLVGGTVGGLALLLLLLTTWRSLISPLAGTVRWRYSFALVLIWAVHAVFTGQLWLPDAMCWYALGLGAVLAGARRERLVPATAPVVASRHRPDAGVAADARAGHAAARPTRPDVADGLLGLDGGREPAVAPVETLSDFALALDEHPTVETVRAGELSFLDDDPPISRRGSDRP